MIIIESYCDCHRHSLFARSSRELDPRVIVGLRRVHIVLHIRSRVSARDWIFVHFEEISVPFEEKESFLSTE